MKIIALILSFYILALNALPCNDTSAKLDHTQIETAFNVDLDHSHTAFDLCPPFCTCHCCHVHTIDFGVMAFKTTPTPMSKEYFAHFNGIPEEVINSLIQPPRV